MKRKLFVVVILFVLILADSNAKNIYVSSTGNDSNPGTRELPLLKIQAGINIAAVGDTIFVRGGVYAYNSKISISSSGTAASSIYLLNYPGEHPQIDFTTQATGVRGIELKGNYWFIRGLEIFGSGDNGLYISGKFNTIDNCSFHDNEDTGLQISGGGAKNRIINCDSYFNRDATEGNADGFAPKLDVGDSNYFYGCRAWQNSDDGWDGYLRPSNNVNTILENCWCFMNGYLPNGAVSSGNGNGFKLGGSDTKLLMHNFTVRNCLAFDNRVKGFDQNNNKGAITLYNCSAYRNGINYGMGQAIDSSKGMIIKNCLALGDYGSVLLTAVQAANSWMSPLSCTPADMQSMDTAGVRVQRNPDGSLPFNNFMRLNSSSSLIDKGVPVGIAYYGTAPDVGAYEFNPASLDRDKSIIADDIVVFPNYPNPFNPETRIRFRVNTAANIGFQVYSTEGVSVFTIKPALYQPGVYDFTFNGNTLPSAVYYYRVQTPRNNYHGKMLLLK